MRDLFRWLLHWLSAPVAVTPEGNLDVEIGDYAKYTIAISDHAKYDIALSDRTRGL